MERPVGDKGKPKQDREVNEVRKADLVCTFSARAIDA
jgi:hypothetical protein